MNDELAGLPGLEAPTERSTRFVPFRSSEFRNRPAMRALVEGLIPERSIVCLAGESGDGKTWWALMIAYSVATAVPVWGRAVTPGPVLYCDGEDGDEMAKRTAAMEAYFGNDDPEVHFLQETLDLADPVVVAEFIRANEGTPWSLVVLDTYFAHTSVADDNQAGAFKVPSESLKRIRDAFGCAVLVLEHAVKPDKEGKRSRGAAGTRQKKAFYAAMYDLRCKGELEHGDPVEVVCLKMKGAARPAPFRLTRKMVGPALVLELADDQQSDTTAADNANARRVLQALAAITQDGTPARTTAWQRYFVEMGGSASTFYRWRAEVARGRLVEEGPKGWLLTPGGHALTPTTPTVLPNHSHGSGGSSYSHYSHTPIRGGSVEVDAKAA